ncbi:MAG: PEP/pyruvate-binding domain-containing protein [Dehalococcoidia bacterium]
MEEALSSKALEANLAETRVEDIIIPPEHQSFINLSLSHRGTNQRTREFMLEYHHPYSNLRFVVERWREIMLRDFWFYNALEEADNAFKVLIDISRPLFSQAPDDDIKGNIIQTLLEFIGNLSAQEKIREAIIREVVDVLWECMGLNEEVVVRNSRYFKVHLQQIGGLAEFSADAFDITRDVLAKSIYFWEVTSKAEAWFEAKRDLFARNYSEVIDSIGKPYFSDLREKVEGASVWDDLSDISSFDDIANHFHQAADQFDSALERIYFIVFLLNLSGMNYLKDSLILDINRLLGNVHQDLNPKEIRSFSENLFALFDDLKSEHVGTVLDCLLTLGKEVIDTGAQEIIDGFVDRLVRFGFITPGEMYVDSDWQVRTNVHHLKNIRVWLELIGHDPARMGMLITPLIVNLRLGGVFVVDTDLFQRDISRLLNSEIAPVYRQVKELVRIFPIYFEEIGAEGELREITTQVDELSHRRDRLIHFLRKQTHTESNATHLELVRKIIRFWYEGSVEPMMKLLPRDVLNSIDVEGEWFQPVHGIVNDLCERMTCYPERLFDVDSNVLELYLGSLSGYEEKDKDRVRYLIRIHDLLGEKYSFEMDNVTATLRKGRLLNEEKIEQLAALLADNNKEEALRQVYLLMGDLKQIILNPEESESTETIYHKRHVAAGIPSIYGRYSEPKFEALGLTFRLENLVSRLIERIVDDINLNYITTRHLRSICSVLDLFREGLEIDGISHERFNANLKMLESSFTSASCSLEQYTNIFEFLERNVNEIIDNYFLSLYEQPLRIIIPQHIRGEDHLSEAEARQLLHRRSEEFYREVLSSTFLIQTLDNFISSTLTALRNTSDSLPPEMVHDVMTYDPQLMISSLSRPTPVLDNQIFLGAKAFFLKAMYAAGFPVPEGFVLTTEVFRHREAIMKHPHISEELERLIREQIAELEQVSGYEFGNPRNPLLLSVRSGAAMSMPGAMSTLLNVGMNDQIAEGLSRQPALGRTAWDCYRRFLQSWGMACGIERGPFDRINEHFESEYDIRKNTDFTREQMKEVALEYKKVLEERDIIFDDDPLSQLRRAIIIVMDSWSSDRARVYREHLQIADEWGTAVIVQKMVLGNIGERSGTGVLLTHDPYEVKPGINPYGDFRICSQGEDVVTGWLNTLPLTEEQRGKYEYDMDISLESFSPQVYRRLIDAASQMVDKYDLGPQEIEFTFEGDEPGNLYILQARRQEIQRRDKRNVFTVPAEQMELVGRGIGIGGGALSGLLAFDMNDLRDLKERFPDSPCILVRPDTVPDDIEMVFECDGLLTGKGGATSHAAVTAVRLGKVCVVGCKALLVNEAEKSCTINGVTFNSGDEISIEGYLGNIYRGRYPSEYVDI